MGRVRAVWSVGGVGSRLPAGFDITVFLVLAFFFLLLRWKMDPLPVDSSGFLFVSCFFQSSFSILSV